MKLILAALVALSLSAPAFAEGNVKVDEAKTEAKTLTTTVKKDHKKLGKKAKSETAHAWNKTKALFKKSKKETSHN